MKTVSTHFANTCVPSLFAQNVTGVSIPMLTPLTLVLDFLQFCWWRTGDDLVETVLQLLQPRLLSVTVAAKGSNGW